MKSFNIQFMETESHKYDETQFDIDATETMENIVYQILDLWDSFVKENNLTGHVIVVGVGETEYDGED